MTDTSLNLISTMKPNQSQIAYGLLLVLTGGTISLMSFEPSRLIQYILSAGLLLSAGFAFVTASADQDIRILRKYHRLQGAGMLVYSLAILLLAPTFETFMVITMVFLLYFGITEILFGFQVMGYKPGAPMRAVSTRMIAGLVMSIGAVLMLATAFSNKQISLFFAGALIALSGVNFILFENATIKRAIHT